MGGTLAVTDMTKATVFSLSTPELAPPHSCQCRLLPSGCRQRRNGVTCRQLAQRGPNYFLSDHQMYLSPPIFYFPNVDWLKASMLRSITVVRVGRDKGIPSIPRQSQEYSPLMEPLPVITLGLSAKLCLCGAMNIQTMVIFGNALT